MNAVDARDEMEAAIWRNCRIDPMAVDAILAAADTYATAVAAGELASYIGRQRLAQLTADIGPAVHYPGITSPTACRSSFPRGRPRHITGDLYAITCGACKRNRGYKDDLASAQRRAAA